MAACTSNRHAALRAELAAEMGLDAISASFMNTRKLLEAAHAGLEKLLRVEQGARWISDYVAERVTKEIPPNVRRHLVPKREVYFRGSFILS